jgi:hypothetical protein
MVDFFADEAHDFAEVGVFVAAAGDEDDVAGEGFEGFDGGFGVCGFGVVVPGEAL